MTSFGISAAKEKLLDEKMSRLGIKNSDLEEKFIRSGGAGGQNVNKVASCVYIKHRPTGTEVKCQKERSQALNRYYARKLLVEKIEQQVLGRLSEKQREISKLRRQKRRRSRRSKIKILEAKKHRADQKKLRAPVSHFE